MALFRSERGIGRGEVAESRLEGPIFLIFTVVCAVVLFAQHIYLGSWEITTAFAVSLVVFGVTVAKVSFGVYILILAMLLSPEIDAGNALSGERNLNIRYDDILILVIFLGVMAKLTFEGRLSPWRPSPINFGIVAYYGICMLSTLLALERGLGAWDRRTAMFVMLKMLEFYLIFFLVGQAVRKTPEIRGQLTLFFFVALVVSIYGIYSVGTTPRVSAPFEQGGTEPNTLGGYLVICMCTAMGIYTQSPRFRYKIAFLAVTLICFFPFLYTLSRASYLALIVGIGMISLVSRKFVILILLAAVLASSAFVMPDAVIERVKYTFQPDSGQEVMVGGAKTGLKVDKSTHERVQVWRKVRFILSQEWQFRLLGGGVSWETVLDSQYARVILESGLLGLAAFIFLQGSILYTARQAYRWTEDWVGRGVAMGVFGATVGLIVHSMGTISFLIVRIMEPYWFLVALCVVVRNESLLLHWERHQARRRAAEADSEAAPPLTAREACSGTSAP